MNIRFLAALSVGAVALLAGSALFQAATRGGTPQESPTATMPSDITPSTTSALPSIDAAQALRDAQVALEQAGGYTLAVEQSNFVLPQWGGADGGTVHVSGDGLTAQAEFARTGEGGPYAIVLTRDQTFFRRATCPTWARIPGGGRDVLWPFLFAKNKALATATNARRDGETIRAHLEGIGDASIEIDAGSGLPVRIVAGSAGKSGRPLRWEFVRWGEPRNAPPPVADSIPPTGIVDRGPGGNPC